MAVSGGARKLGGFGLAVVVAFAAAYGVGQAVGPMAAEPEPAAEHDGMGVAEHGGGVPKGLMVSADGLTLDVRSHGLRAGGTAGFAFRVLDDRGAPVTRFAPTHDKLMHLVVARRDLSGFQHLHPVLSADGTWRAPLTFPAGGDYRVFADFLPAGRDEGTTLGADVPVAGAYRPVPLPAPSRTASVDGYRVTLAGTLAPGTTSKLTLTVSRGGEPVTDLQQYLAAYGHLIALRQGDLAYLHVHPDATTMRPGPSIVFYAEVPSAGTYRLYLDFKHGDVVRTAELTAVAAPHEEE
ncbi:MAG TPA: hypothetical protein VGP26_24215 [Actinophytocola sp.]|jgi:hypothetical protein|nr:hypothetical protein [Actinophytocola sp.]